ncbi:hypothetical protein OH543_0019135 [Roseomonas sp. SXEYE001]|nr:hypothetical protein [Roseomonas sp. SXEYE001]
MTEKHLPHSFATDTTSIPADVAAEVELIRRLAPEADEAELHWLAQLLANPDLAAARCTRTHGLSCNFVPLGLVPVNERAPAAGNT